MGRVDEAMRRAAGGGSASVVGTHEMATPAGDEVFPGERRPLSVAASAEVLPTLLDTIDPRLGRKVVVDRDVDPAVREQYRRLATSLHAAQAANGLKLIMVSSAVAEEGKSLTAANLALTLSESYQKRVLLVDADLRLPSLHHIFGRDCVPGLAESLRGTEGTPLPVRRLTPRLDLLTAGESTAEPMRALASEQMSRLLEDAREAYDWVVVDTPPVGLLSDARLLSEAVDGVLLLVRAASTPYDAVQRAVAAVGAERVLGLILNRAEVPSGPEYRYHRYYQAAPQSGRGAMGT